MKKILACLAIAILAMSFQSEMKIYHYPDFLIDYSLKTLQSFPKGTQTGWDGFCNGKYVSGENGTPDYLKGIDSVAVFYKIRDEYHCYHVTCSNYYSRIDSIHWKKYDMNKKIVHVISEYRNELETLEGAPQSNVRYYLVK